MTDFQPGPFDALEKLEPGEPRFVLLGRDHAAPATITEWSRIRRNKAMREYGESTQGTDKAMLVSELLQCKQAEEIALSMADWRSDQRPAEGTKATYNDVIRTAEEIAEAGRRSQREAACRHLRECAYHLNNAREMLAELELISEVTQQEMMLALARVNGIADEYETNPRRRTTEPQLTLPETTDGR